MRDYAEVSIEHFVENVLEHNFSIIYVDAWETDDDNEEGIVAAKVYGSLINGEPIVFSDYMHNPARGSKIIKEAIATAKLDMLKFLNEQA